MDNLALVSALLGLTYVIAWSCSFYPQPLHNLARHSTSGTTISFPILNLAGFAAYTIYTGVFCFSPVIRQQYATRHPSSPTPSVSPWDFVFAAHGFVIIVVTLSQFWSSLWGWNETEPFRHDEDAATVKKAKQERDVGAWVWAVCFSGAVGVASVGLLVLIKGKEGGRDASGWAYIDIVYAFSNLKLYLTFLKYIPQIVLNYRRQSTEGWSIYQILLDFAGGVAGILQLFVDSYRFAHRESIWDPAVRSGKGNAGWTEGVDGNMAKLWLGNVSILFDIIYMVQHYILYRQRPSQETVSQTDESDTGDTTGTERQPLLGTSEGV